MIRKLGPLIFILACVGAAVWFGPSLLYRSCTVGEPEGCPEDQACAWLKPGETGCVPRFTGRTPFLRFPFEPRHEVFCTQGAENETGAHRLYNNAFALDLASPSDAPAGVLHSPIEGTAVVVSGCVDRSLPKAKPPAPSPDGTEALRPAGTPPAPVVKAPGDDDPCGSGFGNHVRVLSPRRGLLVLFAHLGTVLVQDGQVIQAGEAIGTEGQSGPGTHRHLHFSVHAIPTDHWPETLNTYRKTPGALPPSISFETQYCDPAVKTECVRVRSRVEKMPCRSGPGPKTGEILQGIRLRADWRE